MAFRLALLLSAVVVTSVAGSEKSFTLATATPGGGFQLFGRALIESVAESSAGARLVERETAGSSENPGLLLAGEVDLALVSGDAADRLFRENPEAARQLAVLWVMYPSPGAFAVPADSPVQSFADLKGKRIVWGTEGSGLRLLARDAMLALGWDPERDFESIVVEKASDAPKLVIEGKADALWGGGMGWPGFSALANSAGGARLIGPDAEELNRILAAGRHLAPMEIPAGSYRGQTGAVPSFGLWAVILVRRDLADTDVATLAEWLHRAGPTLSMKLDQGRFSTAANTAAYQPAERLHPAVVAWISQSAK